MNYYDQKQFGKHLKLSHHFTTEAYTAVNIHTLVLCVMTPCYLIGGHQNAKITYVLHLPWRWRHYVSPKRWYLSIRLYFCHEEEGGFFLRNNTDLSDYTSTLKMEAARFFMKLESTSQTRHPLWRWRHYVSPKRWYLPIRLYFCHEEDCGLFLRNNADLSDYNYTLKMEAAHFFTKLVSTSHTSYLPWRWRQFVFSKYYYSSIRIRFWTEDLGNMFLWYVGTHTSEYSSAVKMEAVSLSENISTR
jgi:hypothetical protein